MGRSSMLWRDNLAIPSGPEAMTASTTRLAASRTCRDCSTSRELMFHGDGTLHMNGSGAEAVSGGRGGADLLT